MAKMHNIRKNLTEQLQQTIYNITHFQYITNKLPICIAFCIMFSMGFAPNRDL